METGPHVIFMELHFDDGARSTCKPFKRRSASCTIPLLNGCGGCDRRVRAMGRGFGFQAAKLASWFDETNIYYFTVLRICSAVIKL